MKTAFVLSLLFPLLPLVSRAESEPDDNTEGGATEITINGEPHTGSIVDPDNDYYRFTNSEGFTSIEVIYQFDGDPSEWSHISVYQEGPVGTFGTSTTTSNVPEYLGEATIQIPSTSQPASGHPFKNATYIVKLSGNVQFMASRPYTLTVVGHGAPDPNAAQIASVRRQITATLRAIRKSDNRKVISRNKKKLKRLRSQLQNLLG